MPFVLRGFAESGDTTGMTIKPTIAPWGDPRSTNCIVRQRQRRLHGHVGPLLEVNPAHRVVSVRYNPEWGRPVGRPQIS